jgi:hypothetical protein
MKAIYIIIICVFYAFFLSAQKEYNLKLTINDSILILKNKKQDALKVNVTLEFTEDIKNLVLYHFNENVITYPPLMLSSPEGYKHLCRLTYMIEDETGNLIIPTELMIHFENEMDEFSCCTLNKKKLRIKYKYFEKEDECELFKYKMSKYIMYNNKQDFILYPIIYGCMSMPFYTKLPIGEYYLYFIYSINRYYGDALNEKEKQCDINVLDGEKQFVGTIKSNKVKLIIK